MLGLAEGLQNQNSSSFQHAKNQLDKLEKPIENLFSYSN